MVFPKNDDWKVRLASVHIDVDASTHDLLNDATELLQYARGVMAALIDLSHEGTKLNRRTMAFSLGGVEMLTQLGVRCLEQAHASVAMERASAMFPGGGNGKTPAS
jgi:hypothetical protein